MDSEGLLDSDPKRQCQTASIEDELLLMGKDVYNDESFSEKVSVWTSDEYRYEVEAEVKSVFAIFETDQTDIAENRTIKGVTVASYRDFVEMESAILNESFEGKVWKGDMTSSQAKARFDLIVMRWAVILDQSLCLVMSPILY